MNGYSSWFDAGVPEGPSSRYVTRFEPTPDARWMPRPEPKGAETVPVGTPPVLYVPCVRPPENGDAEIQRRTLRDGKVALLAYTALDRLIAHCGASQPWVMVYTARLGDLDQVFPFDVLLLDLPVPFHARAAAGSR